MTLFIVLFLKHTGNDQGMPFGSEGMPGAKVKVHHFFLRSDVRTELGAEGAFELGCIIITDDLCFTGEILSLT